MKFIDNEDWPALATVPSSLSTQARFRWTNRKIQQLLDSADIQVTREVPPSAELQPGKLHISPIATPTEMVIYDQDSLIRRIIDAGWVGLGESYMAQEWSAPDPAAVLLALSGAKRARSTIGGVFERRSAGLQRTPRTDMSYSDIGTLPFDLCATYTDPTFSTGSGEFLDGARTRIMVKGIDSTILESPYPAPVREDLFDSQRRRIAETLDDGDVGPGSRVLVLAAEWGELVIEAAIRGADVTVRALSDEQARVVSLRTRQAGVGDAVEVIQGSVDQLRGHYDCVIMVDHMEQLGEGMGHVLDAVKNLITSRGRVIIQQPWATPLGSAWQKSVLSWTRCYVWPRLHIASLRELDDAMKKSSHLCIVARTRFPGHYSETVRLWDDSFRGHPREVAALGYDAVFRRMWEYHLSVLRFCVNAGHWDYQRVLLMLR